MKRIAENRPTVYGKKRRQPIVVEVDTAKLYAGIFSFDDYGQCRGGGFVTCRDGTTTLDGNSNGSVVFEGIRRTGRGIHWPHECGDSFMSKSGQKPKVLTKLAEFRSGIAALGTGCWQADFALQLTWCYLYLVEFADWDGQTAIGKGNCDSGKKINTGGTDSMTCHTGRPEGTDGKTAVQYRNIENLWGNVRDWRDGIIFDEEENVCTYNNPADFKNTYNGAGGVVMIGGKRDINNAGAFSIDTVNPPDYCYSENLGSRIQKLPRTT